MHTLVRANPIVAAGIAVLFFCMTSNCATPAPARETYSDLWRAVDSLMSAGLTQSALDKTEKLLLSAKTAGNSEQIIKAVMYRMRLESVKEENALVKTLNRLTAEIVTADVSVKPLLYSIRAECYWHYYRNNRWRFYNRTQITEIKNDDISTWDLRTIIEKITESYIVSLQDADTLKSIRLEKFGGDIMEHRLENNLRPTLYDFLAHRAIDYFSIDDNELTKPAFEFTLAGADYFLPFDDFVRMRIITPDTTSLKFHAITLLQKLLVFHTNDTSPEALIDADLKRLDFVRQRSVVENKDSLYLGALRQLEGRFKNSPASAEVTFRIAQLYSIWAQTRIAHIDEQYRWMNREALALCEKAIKAFPHSYGASHCSALADQLRTKRIDFSIESVNLPDKPFKALLTYTNIKKIYWRQVALPIEKYRNYMEQPYRDSTAVRLASIKPLAEWSTDLPDPGDFQQHSVEVPLPPLPPGHYVILCSSGPVFTCKNQSIAWGSTQTSRISYLERDLTGGGRELHLIDREKGTPLPGAQIKVYSQVYDQVARKYRRIKYGEWTTDKEGYAAITPKKKQGDNCSIVATLGNERLDSDNQFYLYAYGKPERPMERRTFFFTDRAIYRPGQTIYFKAILLSTDGTTTEIVPNKTTGITFLNTNGQEVAHLDCTSNSYGSISGSFTAPTGVLNGQMHITDGYGSQYFSVEEYKRPKFSVVLSPFEGSKRLGDSIRIIGKTTAYAGASIDSAQVKYCIVRTARFPDCWWCWWRPARWSGSMEIGSGCTVTNDTGGFSIDFIAAPDRSIPKKEKPVFSYSISVDVTDINGETRSTSKSVGVGYAALTLTMAIPQQVNCGSTFTIPLATANGNGVFVPAAGSISIYKLAAPSTARRSRPWNRPDTMILTEKKYHELFPTDLFGNENDLTTWKHEKSIVKTPFDTKTHKDLTMSNITSWQPGVYMAEGKTVDWWGNEVTDVKYFTIYSETGKKLPFPQPDFFVAVNDHGEPGDTARFLIGSSSDTAQLFYEIEHKGEIVGKEWFTLNNSQRLLSIPIEEKHRGGFSVHFSSVHDNRAYNHSANITVPWTNKDLAISFETFRDKLLPGEKEQWKLKITGVKKDKVAAEMVAALYDASLDAFTPHGWSFGIYPTFSAMRTWGGDGGFGIQSAQQCASNWNLYSSGESRNYPSLNWFGYRHGYSVGRRGVAGIGYGGEAAMEMSRVPRPSGAPPVRAAAPNKELMKSAISADEFGKGGFAADIDGVLAGTGGLKDENNQGTPRNVGVTPPPDLSNVAARTNLNETAFFFPALTTNDKSEIVVNFTVPEALTRWNMLGFAHTKDLRFGQITNSLVTRKELMVMPNLPRFFRENDRITLTAKVSNLSDSAINGTAQLFLIDATTMKPVDAAFKNISPQVSFTAKKGQSAPLAWDLSIPESISAVSVKIVAKANKFTDGEEQALPVLSNRMLVTESIPLPIRKKEIKQFTFTNLISQNGGSSTLRNHKLTLEYTSNPSWYAIQALPYLMEYPYECAEQTFNRYYANSLAAHIVNSSPRIKTVFDQWRTLTPEALMSNLEKNQDLKSVALEETPWLLDGKNESERKQRVALLFDLNKMAHELDRALVRLEKLQLGNGGWPWFDGMPDDRYITQYIVTGIGKLQHLGVMNVANDRTINDMLSQAVTYLDNRIREDWEEIKKHGHPEDDHCSEIHIHYLYMRSFFKNQQIAKRNRDALEYFSVQSKKYWCNKRRSLQAMIALALSRSNDPQTSAAIIRSLKENAIVNEEMGMYWKEMYEGYSWWWYEAPVESQALMIEAFEEVARDTVSAENLKAWLLKSKQTQDWKTTKATADACYALLLRGTKWLDKSSEVSIRLGDSAITPAQRNDVKTEAGTGYFKISWSGSDMTPSMGNVTLSKTEPGVAWGALYWQYFEQLDKIKTHGTPLKLVKKLFLQQQSATGPKLAPVVETTVLKPGDKLTVRIELRIDRDMEYVHMKDLRASGFEPLNVFSGYRWQDGLGYYETTRDAATNFFFAYLRKGTYVFEYPLVIANAGDFSNGITTIQCMYAPEFTSHSEGVRVKVGK